MASGVQITAYEGRSYGRNLFGYVLDRNDGLPTTKSFPFAATADEAVAAGAANVAWEIKNNKSTKKVVVS